MLVGDGVGHGEAAVATADWEGSRRRGRWEGNRRRRRWDGKVRAAVGRARAVQDAMRHDWARCKYASHGTIIWGSPKFFASPFAYSVAVGVAFLGLGDAKNGFCITTRNLAPLLEMLLVHINKVMKLKKKEP